MKLSAARQPPPRPTPPNITKRKTLTEPEAASADGTTQRPQLDEKVDQPQSLTHNPARSEADSGDVEIEIVHIASKSEDLEVPNSTEEIVLETEIVPDDVESHENEPEMHTPEAEDERHEVMGDTIEGDHAADRLKALVHPANFPA